MFSNKYSRFSVPFFTVLIFTFCMCSLFSYPAFAQMKWQDKTSPTAPSSAGQAMAYDSNRGVTVVFGGGPNQVRDETWEWNGESWELRNPLVSPPARSSHTMVYDSDRKVIVMYGGMASEYSTVLTDTWEWNGTNWRQIATTHNPGRRDRAAMAYDSKRKKVVLYGGYYNGTETWEYDGSDWIKKTPANTPLAQLSAAMVYDSMREVCLLFGGGNNRLDPMEEYNETWKWDGNNWTKLNPATSPSARTFHDMAYDSARSKVVLFGGTHLGLASPENDTWEWDGSNWTEIVTATEAWPKWSHSLAFDSQRGVSVLYGGFSSETWEYDGSDWHRRGLHHSNGSELVYDRSRDTMLHFGGGKSKVDLVSGDWFLYLSDKTHKWTNLSWLDLANNPPGRSYFAMCYDSFRKVTALFGGLTGKNTNSNDTWEWNGTSWTQMISANSPPAMRDHVMAFDSVRNVSVLVPNQGTFVYEWDGSDWNAVLPASIPLPPIRSEAAVAFDENRGKLVLFGGFVAGGIFGNDTWEWDGTNWVEITTAQSPSPRRRHSMTYDYIRNVIILHGGQDESYATLSDVWEYDGTNWKQVVLTNSGPGNQFNPIAYSGATGEIIYNGGGGSIWSLSLDQNHKPITGPLSPDAGSGSDVTFVASFRDPNGADDIRNVYFLLNISASTSNAVYLRYLVSEDLLYLRNDANTSWGTGLKPGNAGTLSNSKVIINMQNVVADRSKLDLTLPLSFTLNYTPGTKNVYLRAIDQALLDTKWQKSGTFRVDTNVAPAAVSTSPSSGSARSETFSAAYSDGNGTGDLRYLYFKIAPNASATAHCAYFRYRRASNKLDLRSNFGGSWKGGYVLGTDVILQNNQVKVNMANVGTSVTGNSMTLTLPLEFKDSFAGDYKLYMNAFDMLYATPGWQQKGTFTVLPENSAPTNHSVTPDSGSAAWKTFEAVYRDENGSADLRYVYFKIADSSGAVANCIYVRYRVVTGKFDLRSNAGGSWIYGPVIGTSQTIFNNQVSINLQYVRATHSGKFLTVRLPMIFKSGFVGSNNIYMYCMDSKNANSGWQRMGTFTVTTPAPAEAEEETVLAEATYEPGDDIYLNDLVSGVSDQSWSIDSVELSKNHPVFSSDRAGVFDIALKGRDINGETVISGNQVFIGEQVIMTSDLPSLSIIERALKIRREQKPAYRLIDEIPEEPVTLRLRSCFTPGYRLAFNVSDSGRYQFLELREHSDLERWQWVVGEVQNNRERIIAGKSIEPSESVRTLAIRFNPASSKVFIYYDGSALFDKAIRLRGLEAVDLFTGTPGGEVDVIFSRGYESDFQE